LYRVLRTRECDLENTAEKREGAAACATAPVETKKLN
jgi:hypothetical protein